MKVVLWVILATFALFSCKEAGNPILSLLRNADDLKNKKICFIKGSVYEDYVSQKYPKAEKTIFDTMEEVARGLEKNICDGVITEETWANEYIRKNEAVAYLQDSIYASDAAFAFSKDSPALLAEFNAFLTKMQHSGELEKVISGWTENPETEKLSKDGNGKGGILRFGADIDLMPNSFLRDEQVVGLDIELIYRFAASVNMKVVISRIKFSDFIPKITAGEIDVFGGNLFITDERAKSVAFSIPYKREFAVFIAKNDRIVKHRRTQGLVILHSGNHLGNLYPVEGIGGLAERATLVKSFRKQFRNVLVLDAGNINGGNFLSSHYKAKPDIEAYNMIGYDAVTFGNHEFDIPLYVLKNQINSSSFNWIGTNIKEYGTNISEYADGAYIGSQYVVKNINGLKVGIIGISSNFIKTVSLHGRKIQWLNEIASARRAVKQLESLPEKVKFIILLANFSDALNNSETIPIESILDSVPEIDFVVRSGLPERAGSLRFKNGIPIVSVGNFGSSMGVAHLQIEGDFISNFEWEPILINSDIYKPDDKVASMLKTYSDSISGEFNYPVFTATAKFEQFGTTQGEHLSSKQETALGDLICESMAWVAAKQGSPVDFAMIQGSFIRYPLPKGEVTKKDIFNALPYDYSMRVISLSGRDLIKLVEYIQSIPLGGAEFPQVSKELRYTIVYTHGKNGVSGEISNLSINKQAIDPDKIYNIATSNFLSEGGNGYEALKNGKVIYQTFIQVREMLMSYASSLPQPVSPATDGRIMVVERYLPD